MSRTHPSHSAYVGGCREADCKRAHADYIRANARAKRHHTNVPAAPFTMVLGELYIRGEEIKHMVAVTGCDDTTIRRILWADQRTVWRSTADRLLSVIYLFPEHERARVRDVLLGEPGSEAAAS